MKLKRLLATLAIATMVFTGCGANNNEDLNDIGNRNNIVEDEEPEIDEIQLQIDEMSLEEKVGQMLMVGLEGYALTENDKSLINDLNVGGFILFGRNVESSAQLLELVNSVKEENEGNIPLFISIDEEGGIVTRLPDDIRKMPASVVIGDVDDIDLAYDVGRSLGIGTSAFGVNMDYAPVLDVNTNPNNPVIGSRAFGDNEELVSRMGVAVMHGLSSQNVIPVVKHFPGHGDTAVDSHLSLPLIEATYEEIKEVELVPFKAAIDEGVDVIMVAHILMSSIDSEYPASLSSKIINDILREDLNYDKVVITDDMTMGAIVENYTLEEAAVLFIEAGGDIVLVAHQYDNAVNIKNAIIEAINNKRITEERIDESVYRILELKNKYNLIDNSIDELDIKSINEEYDKVLENISNIK